MTCLTVLVLDFVCLGFVGLLAMMLLVFYMLTPLRHIRFSAEEPSMAAGAAAVNHRGEVIWAGTDWWQPLLIHWEIRGGSWRS